MTVSTWRNGLPTLVGRTVTLREPVHDDARALVEVLSLDDATRFGLDEPVSDLAAQELVERAIRERGAGLSATYVIALGASGTLVGLLQIRQLDPTFEAGEWECTLVPAVRGTGIFVEAARLAGSFAFETIGAHRLESRVPLQHGRANGALRKLGAVQEGVLRRSTRRDGRYFDQVLWSLLKEDWGEHWPAASPRVH